MFIARVSNFIHLFFKDKLFNKVTLKLGPYSQHFIFFAGYEWSL
jgi:hypothetical protein